MTKYVPGDVISANLPLSHILMHDKKNEYCDYCMISNSSLKSCAGCHHMFYCNKVCQKEDWKIHKYECSVYKNHYDTIRHDLDRMLLRLYLTLKHFPNRRYKSEKIPGTVPPQERCYDDLMTHQDDIEMDDKRIQYFEIVLSRYREAELDFERNELFEHFCKIVVNSYSLLNTELNEIGVSLYVLESVFDHSCRPNCAPIFDGIDLEIRALTNISSSDKITVNYTDIKAPKNTRRARLEEQYYFTCSCNRCKKEEEYDDIDYDHLNSQIKRMDDCIQDSQDWATALSIGQETLPIYKKIYEYYHPDLSLQMMRVCKLLLLLNDDLNNETIQFISEASQNIKITHGYNHSLYRLYKEAIA